MITNFPSMKAASPVCVAVAASVLLLDVVDVQVALLVIVIATLVLPDRDPVRDTLAVGEELLLLLLLLALVVATEDTDALLVMVLLGVPASARLVSVFVAATRIHGGAYLCR